MPKITIGTTKFEETLDRGTGRPIEEPYWVPSTFARREVINPVTNGAATVCTAMSRSRLPVKLI